MAKKTSKSPAKKPAKKSPPKKAAAKPASKPAAKPSAKSGGPVGKPSPVKTGSGATPAQIGTDLVALFNRAKFREVEDKYWSPAIESIEGMGMSWKGRANVEAKNADWNAKNAIRGASAEGPFVGATGFAVKFRIDVEDKATLSRTMMEEVGVYTVQNGKIIREEFMYGSVTPVGSAAPTDHQ